MGKKNKHMEYVRANRKGSRDAELENEMGWKSRNRIHKSQKQYNRKFKYNDDIFDND